MSDTVDLRTSLGISENLAGTIYGTELTGASIELTRAAHNFKTTFFNDSTDRDLELKKADWQEGDWFVIRQFGDGQATIVPEDANVKLPGTITGVQGEDIYIECYKIVSSDKYFHVRRYSTEAGGGGDSLWQADGETGIKPIDSKTVDKSYIAGLGDAAGKDVGTGSAEVAVGNHTHAQLHDRKHSVTSADDHDFPEGSHDDEFLRKDGEWATPPSNGGGGSEGVDIVTVTDPTGEAFTISASHINKYVRVSDSDDVTVTVPLDNTYDAPIGAVITMFQVANGLIILEPENNGSPVTLNAFEVDLGDDELPATAGQHSALQLTKVAADTWDVIGAVAYDNS